MKLNVLLWSLVLCVLVGCTAASEEYRQVSMDEAIAMMERGSGYMILDVRTAEEYASGHIPGAINLPNESIGTLEPKELPDKAQLILVYCRSGNRSKQASAKLAAMGYRNIVEFGGIIDWPGAVEAENEDFHICL